MEIETSLWGKASAESIRAVPGFWGGLWKLLRLKALVEIKEFVHSSILNKVTSTLSLLLVTGWIAASTGFSWFFFALLPMLKSFPGMELIEESLRALPGMVLSYAVIFALPLTFALLMQELYLSKEVPFLLPLPIPVRAVLVSRLATAAVPGLAMFCTFFIPFLAALGQAKAYHPLYFITLLLPVTAIFLACAALSLLAVVLIARYVPPAVMSIVLVATAAVLVVVTLAMALISPPRSNAELKFDPELFASLLLAARQADLPFSPLTWAGNGLAALGEGRILGGLAGLSPLLLICVLICVAALLLSEPIYFQGFNRLNENIRWKAAWINRLRPRLPARLAAWFRGRLRPGVNAIILKDIRFFTRDLNYLSVILFPFFVNVLVFTAALSSRMRAPVERSGAEAAAELPKALMVALGFLILFFPVVLSLAMSTSFGALIVSPSISLEGRGFTTLRASPVSSADFLRAKFFSSLLLLVPLYAVFTALLQVTQGGYSLNPILAGYSHFSQIIILTGLIALYLHLGARQARFNWRHPGNLINLSTSLNILAGGLYVVTAVVLFYGVPIGLAGLGVESLPLLFLGPLGGTAFCAWFFRWQMRAAERRVEALFAGE